MSDLATLIQQKYDEVERQLEYTAKLARELKQLIAEQELADAEEAARKRNKPTRKGVSAALRRNSCDS